MLYTTVYLIVMICKSDHQTQHINVCWSVVEMQELSSMQSRHRGTLATVTLCSSQFPQTSEPRLVFSVVTAHIIHQCQCLVRARLQHYSNTALDQHMPPGQCALCATVTQTNWSYPAMFAEDDKWICETLQQELDHLLAWRWRHRSEVTHRRSLSSWGLSRCVVEAWWWWQCCWWWWSVVTLVLATLSKHCRQMAGPDTTSLPRHQVSIKIS